MTTIAPNIQQQWSEIAPILTIRNEQEYDQGVSRLNELIDTVGTNENHPLYTLLDTLGTIIEAYEEIHHPMPESSGAEVLAYLMAEHDLSASDLPELGKNSDITDILSGKQDLKAQQIRVLSKRFKVSPAVFI